MGEGIGNLAVTRYQPKYGMLMDGDYYVKVNFPADIEGEANGNGEGMWVVVDEDTCRKYDEDHRGGLFWGELANDSLYYPGLECGTKVPFSMLGKSRPICPLGWLVENYGRSRW